ncbi:hypothetical protein ACIRPQ_03805 [Streptomyces sp. NPDC101213]|uniref:hypothetical protein n=1 Tax=Streptomyces sp. NPDC101213 TaxID=3366130 RepID=UPI0038156559
MDRYTATSMHVVLPSGTEDPRDRYRRPGGMALNHNGVEDVSNRIALLVEPLLRLLLPASGRHRHRNRHRAGEGAPLAPVPAAPSRHPSPHEALLHGEDSRLVRPYLLAHERRTQAKQQCARRRTLWLAVHGIDVGPRRIHGVDVGPRRIRGNEVTAA